MSSNDIGEIPQNGQESFTKISKPETIEDGMEKTGKLLETPIATYRFQFLSDKRFLVSPNKKELKKLMSISETVAVTETAVKDLEIANKVTILRSIPDEKNKNYIIPEFGIGGFASGNRNEISLFFDPNNPNVLRGLADKSDRMLAHELTHIARAQAGKRGQSLLDEMVNEGLATYYEENWKDEYIASPWGHALTEKQLKDEWKRAQDELLLSSNRQKHVEWFFGKNSAHPRWTGYSIGTAIVNSYFQSHSEAKMVEVVRTDSTDILKESNFTP